MFYRTYMVLFLGIQRCLTKQQMQKSRNKDNNTKNTKMRYNSFTVLGHFEKASLREFAEDGDWWEVTDGLWLLDPKGGSCDGENSGTSSAAEVGLSGGRGWGGWHLQPWGAEREMERRLGRGGARLGRALQVIMRNLMRMRVREKMCSRILDVL